MIPRSTMAFLVCAGGFLIQPDLAARELESEPNHTTIGFSVPIAGGVTRVTGKFTDFKISLKYDGEKVLEDVATWSLEVTIATASIDTGLDQRDEHLRQPDFFDSETFPEIKFTSRRVEPSDEGYVAIGQLDMHGVKKPFRLPFSITGTVRNEVTGDSMIGAVARASLSRSDYGIATDFQHTHIANFLGDEIAIEIYCWFRPAKEKVEEAKEQD